MTSKSNILIVGGGNLARALITGWQGEQSAQPSIRVLVKPEQQNTHQLPAGVQVYSELNTALAGIDLIVLAIKPQDCQPLCRQLSPHLSQTPIPLVSLCAGLRINTLSDWLGYTRASGNRSAPASIIRAMPNLGVAYGQGATALYADSEVTAADRQRAEDLFSCLGLALWVDHEQHMDTVTALSGSGPAYFLLLLKSIIDAGMRLGLDLDQARQLAIQTLHSSAAMIDNSESVGALIDQVACKGGSTRKALDALTAAGFGTSVAEAVGAAAYRCFELDQQLQSEPKDSAVLSA